MKLAKINAYHYPETQHRDLEPPKHSCGRCRTPFGVSSIPCPNDPAARQ